MNQRKLILGTVLILAFASCNDNDALFNGVANNLALEIVDAHGLYDGLLNKDSKQVIREINHLCIDLFPGSASHESNLEILDGRISLIDGLDAEIRCYACLESNPPQSVIAIEVDSSGHLVDRMLNILTPDDDRLQCSSVH